ILIRIALAVERDVVRTRLQARDLPLPLVLSGGCRGDIPVGVRKVSGLATAQGHARRRRWTAAAARATERSRIDEHVVAFRQVDGGRPRLAGSDAADPPLELHPRGNHVAVLAE